MRGVLVGLAVAAAGCSHVRSRLEVAVATDEGTAVCPAGDDCGGHAKVCQHPTVHALACDLDHLEKHIECYGSVVAKVPDVWGQARLTQYREDFEQQMKADLTAFDAGLQGNYARSDQSYLAFALSLGLAAQPKPPVIGSLSVGDKSASSTPPAPILKTVETITTDKTAKDKEVKTTETQGLPDKPDKPKEPDPVKAEAPTEPTKLLGKDAVPFARSDKVELKRYEYVGGKDAVIGIEPAERLAQKKRYLDLLGQFRRENEGSDTADAPGYQLNLMRLPVSVLPGSHTDRGHGAEVTFTIDPILSDDLLPVTFRNMVTNDVNEQLRYTLAQYMSDPDAVSYLRDEKVRAILHVEVGRLNKAIPSETPTIKPTGYRQPPASTGDQNRLDDLLGKGWLKGVMRLQSDRESERLRFAAPDAHPLATPKGAGRRTPAPSPTDASASGAPDIQLWLSRANSGPGGQTATSPGVPFASGPVTRRPFPSSDLVLVYGPGYVFEIARRAADALEPKARVQKYILSTDVQSVLSEELTAAHQFLTKHPMLLQEFATHDLVTDIRSKRAKALQTRRVMYRERVRQLTDSLLDAYEMKDGDTYDKLVQFSCTAALAWAIIVDSALLNDRLIRDMRESATAKGLAPPCPADAWPQFFLPEPPQEARQQFACYVKQRWPIYVFALDPMVQEQNIADSLSTRRETQLALAAGFANGAMSAKAFLSAARRLEADAQTVALTRTQVGFAHGENTFGWRFYPRFQTMPTQTNFTVLFRDQLIGGPTNNAILRQRRLEPGPRECVALVIMPSFVPYVTVDCVSNWFRLPDPKCKLLDHTQAVKLSKTVHTLETCGQTITDAACYRDHELKRLQTRVQQLANRLPAQTLTVPVPIVNTLGGFEMFSNGTTDLAPELYGWYGAPGVSADPTQDTTLFLVGDHFSPLQTRVIVGNTEISKDTTPPNLRMISRQVMQVTVPKGKVVPVVTADGKFAQAHVATPYGVSRELLIPYVTEKPADKPKPAEGFAVKPDAVTVTYKLVPSQKVAAAHQFAAVSDADPGKFEITWADATGSMPQAIDVRFVFEYGGKEVPLPACTLTRLVETDNKFVMTKDKLMTLAQALVLAVQPDGLKPGANPFDTPFATKRIEVTPAKDGVHAVQTKTTANQLTLTLVGQYAEVCPTPAPAPKADPAKPADLPAVK